MIFNSDNSGLVKMTSPFNWDASRWCNGVCVCLWQLQVGSDCFYTQQQPSVSVYLPGTKAAQEKRFEIPSMQFEFGKKIMYSLAPINVSWFLGFCLPVCFSPGGLYSWPPSQHPPLMSQNLFHVCKFAAQLPEEWHEYYSSIWCQMAIQAHKDEGHLQGCLRERLLSQIASSLCFSNRDFNLHSSFGAIAVELTASVFVYALSAAPESSSLLKSSLESLE